MSGQGAFRIDDGSGSIRVEEVARDVTVRDDGSGEISVRRVGGDFRVLSDGGGGVRVSDVEGRVELPPGKHRRR